MTQEELQVSQNKLAVLYRCSKCKDMKVFMDREREIKQCH